jgi:nitrite reductase (NADH) small subunit
MIMNASAASGDLAPTAPDGAPVIAGGSVNLGRLDRIPIGEGRSFRVGAEEIAVFHARSGEAYAVQATCPHRGGPLADGLLGDRRIYCPLHAYAFDLITGEPIRNPCPALRTYPVMVSEAGEVVVGGVGGDGRVTTD